MSLYWLSISTCFIILQPFIRLEVTGKENIPKKGGFILASNHVSLIDPVILGIACPRKLNFMAKEELFKIRLFRFWLNNNKAFPIKRNKSDISAIKEAIKRLKQGLLIFPEGKRINDLSILDVKPGIGLLARKASVPILPVAISGAEKALPKGARFIRFAKTRIKFGNPFEIDKNDSNELSAKKIVEKIRCLK